MNNVPTPMDLSRGRSPRSTLPQNSRGQGRGGQRQGGTWRYQPQQYQPQQYQAYVAQTGNRRQQRAQDGKCFECGGDGHFARNCPKRRKARIAQASPPSTHDDSQWPQDDWFYEGADKPAEYEHSPPGVSQDKIANLRTQIRKLTPEELESLKIEEGGQEGFQQA
jgi:hypothetical protein